MAESFFTVSQPIDKEDFLVAFRDIVLMAHLLTCPFGISDELLINVDENVIQEEFTTLYRQWEEALARRIYAFRGIPDDRIAATLHKYIDDDGDINVSLIYRVLHCLFVNVSCRSSRRHVLPLRLPY